MIIRQFIFSLFLIIFSQFSFSQNPAKIPSQEIVKFKSPTRWAGVKTMQIQCPFAEPQFIEEKDIITLSKGTIIRIELYYTKFRRSESFDQIELNTKRYQNLKKILPNTKDNALIQYLNFEQTGATDVETAEKYFHGFVIYYLPENSELARSEEISALKKHLGIEDSKSKRIKNLTKYDNSPFGYYDVGPKFGRDECEVANYFIENLTYPQEAVDKNIRGNVIVLFAVNRKGEIQDISFKKSIGHGTDAAIKDVLEHMPLWKPASNKDLPVRAYVELNIYFGINPPKNDKNKCANISINHSDLLPQTMWTVHPQQKVISQTLNRQKFNDKTAFVMDVTGSMGPYIADMFDYIKNNIKNIHSFYFFNDGDMMSDYKKEIGKTGGIYSIVNPTMQTLSNLLFEAMENGMGGDLPENDFEAALKAQNDDPSIKKIILAVDNYSFPRDVSLISDIKVPILLILCGSHTKINPQWLTFAKRNKLQVAMSGAFIPAFPDLKDGEEFKVRGETFVWINNGFSAR